MILVSLGEWSIPYVYVYLDLVHEAHMDGFIVFLVVQSRIRIRLPDHSAQELERVPPSEWELPRYPQPISNRFLLSRTD